MDQHWNRPAGRMPPDPPEETIDTWWGAVVCHDHADAPLRLLVVDPGIPTHQVSWYIEKVDAGTRAVPPRLARRIRWISTAVASACFLALMTEFVYFPDHLNALSRILLVTLFVLLVMSVGTALAGPRTDRHLTQSAEATPQSAGVREKVGVSSGLYRLVLHLNSYREVDDKTATARSANSSGSWPTPTSAPPTVRSWTSSIAPSPDGKNEPPPRSLTLPPCCTNGSPVTDRRLDSRPSPAATVSTRAISSRPCP
jgi:hypothetical protein